MDLRKQLESTLGAAYAFERELGGGGMSRVFAAEETRLRRRVVVKVLSPELAAGVSAANTLTPSIAYGCASCSDGWNCAR